MPRFHGAVHGPGDFISQCLSLSLSSLSRNSLRKTVGDIRARAWLPGTGPSALKICGRSPRAEIDGRARATCNYNYKSLGTQKRGRERERERERERVGRLRASRPRARATLPKFIRRRAIRNLNMQPRFLCVVMRGRNERRGWRSSWKAVFPSRFLGADENY